MHFEIGQDPTDGRWCWRLFAATPRLLAANKGYATKADAFRDVQLIMGSQRVPIYLADSPKRCEAGTEVSRKHRASATAERV